MRDLTFLVAQGTSSDEVLAIARASAGKMARSVEVVDLFINEDLARTGQVSMTLSLRFGDDSRTLTSEEVDGAVEAVRQSFHRSGSAAGGVA